MVNKLFGVSRKSIYTLHLLIDTISHIPFLGHSDREILLNVLAHSSEDASPELKLKIYEVLVRLKKRRRKPFGTIVVLGWRQEWERKYTSFPDTNQNLFRNRRPNIIEISQERFLDFFVDLAEFDGAILVNARGEIVASGVYLENMSPKKVAEVLHEGGDQDLSSKFGFVKKVHTRHLAAIAASYWLRGTTVFVVSEEDGSMRIFEDGRILWSSLRREMSH